MFLFTISYNKINYICVLWWLSDTSTLVLGGCFLKDAKFKKDFLFPVAGDCARSVAIVSSLTPPGIPGD